MNPDDNKPTTPAFPTNDLGPSPVPGGQSSAGDDAALQAIEALETESNELPSLDANPDTASVASPPVVGAPPTPVAQTTPISPDQTAVGDTVTPTPQPAPTVPNTPVSPLAASLGESLKEETPVATAAPASFDAFAKPKKSNKKMVIILGIVLAVLILGAGGYFGWSYFQSQNKPATQTSTQPSGSAAISEPDITDTEPDVTQTANDMETQLNATNDDEFSDATISDETLNN